MVTIRRTIIWLSKEDSSKDFGTVLAFVSVESWGKPDLEDMIRHK